MVYLDNLCFNRRFADQQQMRVQIEAETTLFIQERIRGGRLGLVWSYMLDFENAANPFEERGPRLAPGGNTRGLMSRHRPLSLSKRGPWLTLG